jgi:hypothetical protein
MMDANAVRAHREMMKHFTPEQQNRYEAYRRSAFGKNGIKKAQPLSLSHQHHHQPISRAITRVAWR